jgi:hypothetical protein
LLIVYGANSVNAFSKDGMASLVVDNDAVHSLKSTGSAGELRAVMKRADVFCKSGTMVCVVEDDHPSRERLLRLYSKFGFATLGTIMKRTLSWATS